MKSTMGLYTKLLFGVLVATAARGVSSAEGWPVVCRPDASTHLVYVPADGGWMNITGLRPAPQAARTRLPAAGQCAFYDRPMNREGEKDYNGRLEFTLRLPARELRHLRIVPLGRGSGLLARNGRFNDFFLPIIRGQVFRFMARRTGRGKYEITSLDYDVSRLGHSAPHAVPAAPGDRARADDRTRHTAHSAGRVTAQPAPPVGEDCLAFDRNNLRLENIGGRWKIVDGNHWLFDFDGKRREASRALRIIHHYKMDSVCYVGRPQPGMTYLLSRGRIPMGSYHGEDCVRFDPNRVQAKRINGRWKVVEGSHWIFDFGNKADAARQAVRLIRKYGFTKSCFVGRPDPSFKYLRG